MYTQVTALSAEKQLELAHKLVLHAFRTRVTSLEAHVTQGEQQTTALRAQVAALEAKLQQAQQQLLAQQQQHTTMERQHEALMQTIKEQQRAIARLQGFRDTLMQSISVATTACDTTHHDPTSPTMPTAATHEVIGNPAADLYSQQLIHAALHSVSPNAVHTRTQHTHSPTPPTSTTPGSPCAASMCSLHAAHAGCTQQQQHAGVCYPDGKVFFSECRQRLSYEAFGEFLNVVKRLNSGQCSRQEALQLAGGVLGSHNGDLLGMCCGVTWCCVLGDGDNHRRHSSCTALHQHCHHYKHTFLATHMV